jgi:hypothetical protein
MRKKNNLEGIKQYLSAGILSVLILACSTPKKEAGQTKPVISDDSLLTLVEYKTFQYFWDGAEPTSGAARQYLSG